MHSGTQGIVMKPPTRYWLFKSEPDVFSFGDLKARPGGREPWTGVRSYQARNYMRDDMRIGDAALFYHSSCAEPGVAGVMRIASQPYPDPTQFDPQSEYFDPKAGRENPPWRVVEVEWAGDFRKFVSLEMLRADPRLGDLLILRKGNRLSITPLTAQEFRRICRMGGLAFDRARVGSKEGRQE
jgi:predicted RNA-binding protein with PUA-like domain